jgi:replicative DNA helicase
MFDGDPREIPEVDPLPKNVPAEQDLLGAVMYDTALLERMPDRLRGAHFFEPFHQRLFDAITEAVTAGRSASPSLLADGFRTDPGFNDFGGTTYLLDLMNKAPPARVALEAARSILDLAVRRDLLRIADDITAQAVDPALPATEHVAAAENALFSLAESGEQAKALHTFADALDGAMDMIEAAYKRDGQLTGLSTGLVDLDQKLGGLHPSDLLILAGRPSMGKTALATNIAYHVAKTYQAQQDPDAPHGRRTVAGGRVLFASLEMSKEQLAQRILADASGVSSDKMRKGLIDRADFERIRNARDLIRQCPLHIDETGGIHIAKLCARARRQHRREGLDLLIVDYLQLATTGDGRGQRNRTQEVSEITGALKALAKELGIPVIALSQLSRQVESRDDKRPMLSDLRESGSIEQDADCVMFVYRESYYLSRSEPRVGSQEHLAWTEALQQCQHQAEVIIGKQRHGPIGTVRLSFDDDTTRFGNLARDSEEQARSARFSFGGDD